MFKKQLIIIFLLIMGLAFVVGSFKNEPTTATSELPAVFLSTTSALPLSQKTENKAISVSLNKAEKKESSVGFSVERKPYKVFATATSTIFALMENLAKTTKDFTFSSKEFSGLGYFIEEINHKRNADGYYWTLYINGRLSTIGASQYLVLPNDQIEWRYERNN